MDALAPKRSDADTNRVSERVVSQMLTELDGIEELVDVIVLASTNRVDMVDPAILRSGRFDMIVEIPPPSDSEILDILTIHTKQKPLEKDVNLKKLAAQMKGLTGADIELICNRASIISIRGPFKKAGKGCLKFPTSILTSQ